MKELNDPTTMAQAHNWITTGETGASSLAIWAQMMGSGKPRFGYAYPLDPADFSRCERLLRAVPAWRSRLPEMGSHERRWSRLAARWTDIVVSMEEEVGIHWDRGNSAPRTYALMQEIMQ